jgi:predicted ArsR family transcriptional regulator
VKRVLRRVTDEKVAATEPGLRGMSLEEKVAALKSWYLEDDPYMNAEKAGGDFRLVERNCPFLNTAMRRPALCSVSVNALTKLFGVRVRREEKFQNGDGRCVFHVYANEPVNPSAWEFQFEADLT